MRVPVEKLQRDLVECCLDRGDLRQDVDAVPLVVDHPLDAAHLPLDPVEALDQPLLVLDVRMRHPEIPSRALLKRRSRRLLVTTNTLENAIAAAAMIGLSSPAAASGIAATL